MQKEVGRLRDLYYNIAVTNRAALSLTPAVWLEVHKITLFRAHRSDPNTVPLF